MKPVLLFDFDGVIANSFDVAITDVNTVCKRHHNITFTKEEFLELFYGNFYESLVGSGIPEELMPVIIEDSQKELEQHIGKIGVFPGVQVMIAALSPLSHLAIITSSMTPVVKAHLHHHSITEISEIYGAEIEHSKVKKIAMFQEKYPDHDIYYIGDTVGDIKEGKEAGVTTIAVSWGFHLADELAKAHPDHLFHTPQEVIEFFRRGS